MSIGFFSTPTPQFDFPHPPIALPVYLILEDAIRVAWVAMRQLAEQGLFDLKNADEDTITQKLEEVLIDVVYDSGQVDGFGHNLFAIGTREAKVRNYDGTMLDKMPDLRFGVVGRTNIRRTQDWIFVECKPVDINHPTGEHYCNKGIIRFVKGEYAWAMTSSLMIGYSAEGYTVDPKLIDSLKKPKWQTMNTVTFPYPCPRSTALIFSEVTYISEHERTFQYVEINEKAPSIFLRHLWLKQC